MRSSNWSSANVPCTSNSSVDAYSGVHDIPALCSAHVSIAGLDVCVSTFGMGPATILSKDSGIKHGMEHFDKSSVDRRDLV
jgi:hypothetical protein